MTDPPAAPSSLAIEAVHWFAHGGENLTVRVTGRWRRRRPSWSGQPVLVIEAQGQRHRFPAMPEPPSVTGTAPGTWQMSFSVPASLAPHLGGKAWLQLGAVIVPLPIEVQPEGLPPPPPPAPDPDPDPDTLAQRRMRSSELAVEAARRRAMAAEEAADDLAARIQQLERALEQARREPERLHALLAEHERATRAVEQRAYAERALREELEEQLAQRMRPARDADEQRGELAAMEERVRELEAEIERLRRQTDEAEQVAAAAHAARERAARERERERTASERERAERRAAERPGMRTELELAHRPRVAVAAPAARSVIAAPHEPLGLRSEHELINLRRQLGSLLARESKSRAESQARVSRLERELHDSVARCARAYDAIEGLRDELEAGRAALASQLGGKLAQVQSVDPGRLEAALTRLRETSPAPASSAEGLGTHERSVEPASDWLARVFKALTRRDAAAAGRLVLALLPAQGLVETGRFAYDLVLQELGCVRVSVAGGVAGAVAGVEVVDVLRVEVADSPRPSEEVRFQVIGDLASLARLLASGPLRRRIGRGRARVKGNRRALSALTALVRAPLSLHQLYAEGVRMSPLLAFTVLSLMVDPEWTKAERFTIAHQDSEAQHAGVYLNVRDGAQLSVNDTAPSAPVTTIVCPADVLLAVLYGESPPEAEVRGDQRPLALLQSWVKRAQSG